jgi:hypothetical protein
MSTQLDIPPEVAEKLMALAKARGVSVDELLQEVLDELNLNGEVVEPSLEEFERDMDALSEGLEHLPAGYQGTYSREDIYLDHK